jgi:hypothetical protein
MNKRLIFCKRQIKLVLVLLLVALADLGAVSVHAKQDFVLEGVYEAALDLPRIYFLLKRTPGGRPLGSGGDFELNYAFLDTGTSGIVISQETANRMGVSLDAKAQFVDVGIGGKEFFNVSEPLYIGLVGFEAGNPQSPGAYKMLGPWRFQVKKTPAGLLGEAIDVIGMPAMVEGVAVLNSGATNSLEYFAADIKKEDDPGIPAVDIEVSFRLQKFVDLDNKNNIAPLPVLTYNPVIDNIVISRMGKNSKGNWLLDTGATVSLISTNQARKLGLIDANGNSMVEPDFLIPVGGIGKMTWIQGFEIDKLTVPTSSGYNLVFQNARLGVQDIKYFDEDKGEHVVIDGVFGSNFLCASAKMEGLLPSDISETMFDNIVLDMQNGIHRFAPLLDL